MEKDILEKFLNNQIVLDNHNFKDVVKNIQEKFNDNHELVNITRIITQFNFNVYSTTYSITHHENMLGCFSVGDKSFYKEVGTDRIMMVNKNIDFKESRYVLACLLGSYLASTDKGSTSFVINKYEFNKLQACVKNFAKEVLLPEKVFEFELCKFEKNHGKNLSIDTDENDDFLNYLSDKFQIPYYVVEKKFNKFITNHTNLTPMSSNNNY